MFCRGSWWGSSAGCSWSAAVGETADEGPFAFPHVCLLHRASLVQYEQLTWNSTDSFPSCAERRKRRAPRAFEDLSTEAPANAAETHPGKYHTPTGAIEISSFLSLERPPNGPFFLLLAPR
jgi:hypothetical protein